MQGLLAAGLLSPACSGRDFPPPEPMAQEYPAYQESDPVPEPARIEVQASLDVETSWLNGRQLIVHVAWPDAESKWGARASSERPAFTVDGVRVQPVDGVVPHLQPTPPVTPSSTPSSAPSATVAPTASATGVATASTAPRPEVVTEPFEKERGHYWFLVRGLGAARTIQVDLRFESEDGPFATSLTLQLSQLDGPVTTTVTPR